MLELKFRKRDEYGNILFTSNGAMEMLYFDNMSLSDMVFEPSHDVELYNRYANDREEELLSIYYKPIETIQDYDNKLQSIWFIPDKYKNLNVTHFLLSKCSTNVELDRVQEELILFQERKMEIILQILIYLVDVMRKNDIVWGVGRGSACASYCLYLIGIHKVNSLKYNLDIKEFLK